MPELTKQNAIPDLSGNPTGISANPERDPFADIPLPKSEFQPEVKIPDKPDIEAAVKAEEPFNLGAAVNRIMAPAYDHISKGVDNLQDSIAGSKMLMGNGEEYPNVEAQLAANRYLKALPADTPEWAIHAGNTLGPILETLPMLGAIAKDAVIGAGLGATPGLAVGIATGTAFPPGEPLTAPAGMVTGAFMGSEANAAKSMGALAAGGLYMQLRR